MQLSSPWRRDRVLRHSRAIELQILVRAPRPRPPSAAMEGGAELDGTTDLTPRSSIMAVPLPFHEASDGAGCRELTKNFTKASVVGKGTYGEVARAHLKGSAAASAQVALKRLVFEKKMYASQGFPVTALREITLLKRLKHKHIVDLREVVVDSAHVAKVTQDGGFHVVLGFMDYDLAGLLERGWRFTVAEILCVSQQMLSGLHFLHLNDIMHRDMKSANILLDKTGQLRITDFGLARELSAEGRYTEKQICSRWYRPPEILLGSSGYGPAVDMWGAACIIAELFVGRPVLRGAESGSTQACDIDQYLKICELCGTPTDETWPTMRLLRDAALFTPKRKCARAVRTALWRTMEGACTAHFKPLAGPRGERALKELAVAKEDMLSLLDAIFAMDPAKRMSARDALLHRVFFLREVPVCDCSDLSLPRESCHDHTEKSKSSRKRRSHAAASSSAAAAAPPSSSSALAGGSAGWGAASGDFGSGGGGSGAASHGGSRRSGEGAHSDRHKRQRSDGAAHARGRGLQLPPPPLPSAHSAPHQRRGRGHRRP